MGSVLLDDNSIPPKNSKQIKLETSTVARPEGEAKAETETYKDMLKDNLENFPVSKCNRCKKDFAQMGPKSFKMCEHCRVQQRQRTKRWQTAVKKKEGVCKRCGATLTDEMSEGGKFVLCKNCREMLRAWKCDRHQKGKCVHCAGVNDGDGTHKVCQKCREKDKNRKLQLEKKVRCNKCSSVLINEDSWYKICLDCRSKKLHSEESKVDANVQDTIVGIAKSIMLRQRKESSITRINEAAELTNRSNTNNKRKQALVSEEPQLKKKKIISNKDIASKDDSSLSREVVREIDNVIHSSNYENELAKYKTHIDSNMLLSEDFDLSPHDHSQLNQQLEKLSQFTGHSEGGLGDVSGGQTDNNPAGEHTITNSKYGEEVLVNLDDLDGIEIDYDMARVISEGDLGKKRAGDDYQVGRVSGEEGEDGEDGEDGEGGEDGEDESMLQHVRAVQEGLMSNTSEPSDAEIAAAVEAVAVAAAVANNRKNLA